MLVGLIHPTDGSATLFGHKIGSLEAKSQIGYLPELYRYQEWLTGEEEVRFSVNKMSGVLGMTSNPFGLLDHSSVPSNAFIIYAIVYTLVAFFIGLIRFQRKDL